MAAPTSSLEAYPQQGDLHLFRVPHGTFIKMHEATWHAGPLFEGAEYLDFYNLELADTNVVRAPPPAPCTPPCLAVTCPLRMSAPGAGGPQHSRVRGHRVLCAAVSGSPAR